LCEAAGARACGPLRGGAPRAQPTCAAARAADLSDTELDKREDACLDAFHQLLTSAHFRLLSPEDWATAQADAFTARAPASGLQDCRGGGGGGALCSDSAARAH